jgi:hypothetical protein
MVILGNEQVLNNYAHVKYKFHNGAFVIVNL